MLVWKLVGTNEVGTRGLKTISGINPSVHSNFGIANENITAARLTLVVGTITEHHLLQKGSMADTLVVTLVVHTWTIFTKDWGRSMFGLLHTLIVGDGDGIASATLT
jgi:hypothetical protein